MRLHRILPFIVAGVSGNTFLLVGNDSAEVPTIVRRDLSSSNQVFTPQKKVFPISSSLNGITSPKPVSSVASGTIVEPLAVDPKGVSENISYGSIAARILAERQKGSDGSKRPESAQPRTVRLRPISSTQSGSSGGSTSGYSNSQSTFAPASQSDREATVPVRSYIRKDGVRVKAHHRTMPDGMESNNRSAPR